MRYLNKIKTVISSFFRKSVRNESASNSTDSSESLYSDSNSASTSLSEMPDTNESAANSPTYKQ
jgi:hypothetical protein